MTDNQTVEAWADRTVRHGALMLQSGYTPQEVADYFDSEVEGRIQSMLAPVTEPASATPKPTE